MIRNAVICFAIVVAVGLVLLAIWDCYWDMKCCWGVLGWGDWAATAVIILFAFALIACRWWKVCRQRRKPRVCDAPCTPSDSPYPAPGWKCITGFWFKTDLCLARLKERDPRFGPEEQYLVAKEYCVCVELDGTKMDILIPRGAVTDLASVPRIFRWYVGRVGPHLEATIVHDWLYVAWQEYGLTPTDDMRLFSDKVMLAAMLASGMTCKAYVIYRAIRIFGACIFYGRNRPPLVLEPHKMPDCC